jgi:hypothetical protein
MSSPYEVLGVKEGASARKVKDAYKKRVSEIDEDAEGAEEKFKKIEEAGEKMGNMIEATRIRALMGKKFKVVRPKVRVAPEYEPSKETEDTPFSDIEDADEWQKRQDAFRVKKKFIVKMKK